MVMLGRTGGRLAGLDHEELAHHPVVLVLEQVAVEHVGQDGVAVAGDWTSSRTVPSGGMNMVSFQPARWGGGGPPRWLATLNWMPWTWKLCGFPDRLVTSHTSVVSAVTVWSMRPRSIRKSLMRLEPFSSNRRVSDYTGFVELLVVGQPVGHRRRGRQRGSGAELEQVKVSSAPAKRP
jgi:hypothetical protein